MRKLKLDAELLADESSETAAPHVRGAVVGRMPTIENLPPNGAPRDFLGAGTYDEYPCPVCGEALQATGDESCPCGWAPEATGSR